MDSKSGLGILGVLQIIFIVLKVLKLINWSWWAVFIPLWIDIALAIIFIIVLVVIVHQKERPASKDIDDFFNYK